MTIEADATGGAMPALAPKSGEELNDKTAQEVPAKADGEAETKEVEKTDEEKASEAAKTLAERKKAKATERWQTLLQQRRTAEIRAEIAEKRLAELSKALPKPPVIEEYSDMAAFTSDLVKHTLHKTEAERLTAEAETARREAMAQTEAQWLEAVEEAKASFPDFEDVVLSNPSLPISQVAAEVIRAIPGGAALAYQLGKNPAEARRISSLPPLQQVFELAAIQAKMNAPAPRKITQAPEPIKPLGGRGANREPNPDDMSIDEWMKWDAKRMKERRGA